MILIFSTYYDFDTQFVIDWLKYYKIPFFRLNDEDLLSGNVVLKYDLLNSDDAYLIQDNTKIYLKDIEVVWFRKFGFLNSYKKDLGNNSDIFKFVNKEFNILRDLLSDLLKNAYWLYDKNNMRNKLFILKRAHEIGLSIPITLISNNLNIVKDHSKVNDVSYITKPIGESSNIFKKKLQAVTYTKKVDLNKLPSNKIFPSLLQEQIIKKYEVRAFFLEGKIKSMAIFSQNNKSTMHDFRIYDNDFPNRMVPYILPLNIENKIKKLMKLLKLNTGSIDLIKSANDEYFFLEINPSGQFGMTSLPCNYSLHKDVALLLMKKSELLTAKKKHSEKK